MKVKFKVIVILFVILLLALGIFLYMRCYKEDIKFADDLSFEVYSDVMVKDLVLSDLKVYDKKVDTSTTGKKTLSFTYQNRYGYKQTGKISIGVVDTEKPQIVLNNEISMVRGSDIQLKDRIMCIDNYDDEVSIKIEGDYDMGSVGRYALSIHASDKSGNVASQNFTLNVYERTQGGDAGKADTDDDYTLFSDVISKYKNDETMVGADISAWQKDVNFDAMKDAGVDFVFVRAAVQSNKGDDLSLDAYFDRNMKGANEAGIDAGIYVFSKAANKEEAIRQAKFILKKVKKYEVKLPIVFDWENWSDYNTYHLSRYHLNEMAKAFIKKVNDAGYEGMIYGSDNYLKWAFDGKYDNVWVARYGKAPSYEGGDYWQVCDDGKVPGIDTNADIDVYYKK